ncbi:DUF86 domain-containing protein [Candidatus Saccharibacteria bacterium]|nr:DUF86 domain-containing protein [Candidatus Saccharibacteria bacterium]
MDSRDVFLLEMIITYADELKSAISDYSIDEQVIEDNASFRGMVAFFVLQIGEISRSLSDQFKEAHPEVEWGMIAGMRNTIVHSYGKILPDILWSTVISDIPKFRDFCAKQIGKDS